MNTHTDHLRDMTTSSSNRRSQFDSIPKTFTPILKAEAMSKTNIHVKQQNNVGKWYLVMRDEDGSYYLAKRGEWTNDYRRVQLYDTEAEANIARDEARRAEA